MATRKKKKAPAKPKLKAYPSVAAMVVENSSPKNAMLYLADSVHTLNQRLRRAELKIAAMEPSKKPGLIKRLKLVLGL